jgi:hypothetical protein
MPSQHPSVSSSFNQSFSNQGSFGESGSRFEPFQTDRINRLYPETERRFLNTTIGTPQSYFDTFESRFPGVTAGSVYSPEQIGAQSNLLRALGEQQAAGIGRQLRGQFGGRGFGASSPLLAELQGQAYGRSRSAATEAENNLRFQAASANAQQQLGAEELGVRRAGLIGNVASAGRQQDVNRENALLSALNFYNQPLPFSRQSSFGRSRSSGGSISQGGYANTGPATAFAGF